MNSLSPLWVGFENIKKLYPHFSETDFEVLCLPENIESTDDVEKLIETLESIQFYKNLKGQGIKVLSLYDYGIEIPLYDRRCDELYLGTLFIKEIAAPIVLGIISTWISNKWFNSSIHLNLKIQKPEEIISLDYCGDGETLKQVIDSILQSKDE
jgi:hypothetical protein